MLCVNCVILVFCMLLSGKSVELLILSIKEDSKFLTQEIVFCKIFHNHVAKPRRKEAKQINKRQKQKKEGKDEKEAACGIKDQFQEISIKFVGPTF
jgi:hypothetical protein